MPGRQAPRGRPRPPRVLYTVDAQLTPDSPVFDVTELAALCTAAVRAGSGQVLTTSHATFPNGALTLVLILAESHLSIHTWPEDQAIAIDLFSCGGIDGQVVLAELAAVLRLDGAQVRQVTRG